MNALGGAAARRGTLVKVCGVRTPADARAVAAAGADAIGVVLVPGSPRVVGEATAFEIAAAVGPGFPCVAVVTATTMPAAIGEGWSGPIQFHGGEGERTVACIAALRLRWHVIKAIHLGDPAAAGWAVSPAIHALLLDAPQPGGGVAFDWSAAVAMRESSRLPFILAGGLTPDNVGAAIAQLKPDAVDVSSGVESAPGVKDIERVRRFLMAVRAADAER